MFIKNVFKIVTGKLVVKRYNKIQVNYHTDKKKSREIWSFNEN